MVLVKHRCTVGTFTTRQEAEQAFAKLYCAGFPISHISVASKDAELLADLRAAIQRTQADALATEQTEKSPCAMIVGSTVGAIGGCLVSIGILLVPGVAPALAVGTVGTTLAATLFGTGIGLACGGAISTLNCADRLTVSTNVESDRSFPQEYLVIVEGTDAEARRAQRILANGASG
ncbi:MAG: hypothetical protein N4J56_001296 [Chroococcidiopsis sp. SAG 2025]|uniref:hypothetical protein n=1 Tax=Chroococcidiopsis sp. SAG 2025 TaxID=171389 RepID=UPI002937346F|nr:hypothetical protein [Chroococcidiopsis sp. SAG 2025]MDV2991642.1 hypothetical protein [Chroococcidiopsis sp. SAG 2025]